MGDEDEAMSPASSVASCSSAMSVSSDSSPVPSPASTSSADSSSTSQYHSYRPQTWAEAQRRQHRHHLEADETDNAQWRNVSSSQSSESTATYQSTLRIADTASPSRTMLPAATHRSQFDQQLQILFHNAVIKADFGELSSILGRHSHSIDLDKFDGDGHTPLHRLCRLGHLDMVKLLVQHGADWRLRTREGWSLIHIASFAGSSDMLSFVLRCSRQ